MWLLGEVLTGRLVNHLRRASTFQWHWGQTVRGVAEMCPLSLTLGRSVLTGFAPCLMHVGLVLTRVKGGSCIDSDAILAFPSTSIYPLPPTLPHS